MKDKIFKSNDKEFVKNAILTDLENIPCNIWSILQEWLLDITELKEKVSKLELELNKLKEVKK